MTTNTETGTIYTVIPCGAAKTTTPAAARDLYTGSAFRHFLAAAETDAAATTRELGVRTEVLILSALHGLVSLDTVLAPYDVKMGDEGSITPEALAEQITARGITYGVDEVYAMLPRAYRAALAAASDLAEGPFVQDVYEAAPGIGYQRGVASTLVRLADMPLDPTVPVSLW